MEKTFEDFNHSLDPDTYNTIVISAHQAMKAANRSDCDAQTFFIALELLEHYHNWIQDV